MIRASSITGTLLVGLCTISRVIVADGLQTGQRARPVGAEQRTASRFEQLRRDPPALRAFLRRMPKGADLHMHLTGAVYAESYVRWAAEMPLCIDTATFGFVEGRRGVASTDGASVVTCAQPDSQRPAAEALTDPALYRSVIDAASTRFWDPTATPGHYRFFDSFRRFGLVAREDRGAEGVARAIVEVVERAARQNVDHIELMMAFGAAEATQVDVTAGTEALFAAARAQLLDGDIRTRVADRRGWLDAIERARLQRLRCAGTDAMRGCEVSVRYMPYALRGLPPAQVFADALFSFELAAADVRTAGVNLVMPEDWFIPMRDHDLHTRMYRFFRRRYPTVGVALHAGELAFGLVPAEELGRHVRAAVEIAGADRIGHAADLMYDDDHAGLLQEMARRGIAVEVSLSSSDIILGLRGTKHPLRHVLRASVPVVIATDDEGVARSDPTNEYQRAVEEHGLDYRAIKQISRNSIRYSFLLPDDKRHALNRLDAAFAAFESSQRSP
ncbi:MAG: adenosine deaminase [Vicinamibacterales bacterium]